MDISTPESVHLFELNQYLFCIDVDPVQTRRQAKMAHNMPMVSSLASPVSASVDQMQGLTLNNQSISPQLASPPPIYATLSPLSNVGGSSPIRTVRPSLVATVNPPLPQVSFSDRSMDSDEENEPIWLIQLREKHEQMLKKWDEKIKREREQMVRRFEEQINEQMRLWLMKNQGKKLSTNRRQKCTKRIGKG